MNKIYRVKFNHHSGQWAVTSEIPNRRPTRGARQRAVTASACVALMMGVPAIADPLPDNVNLTTGDVTYTEGNTTNSVTLSQATAHMANPVTVKGNVTLNPGGKLDFQKGGQVEGTTTLKHGTLEGTGNVTLGRVEGKGTIIQAQGTLVLGASEFTATNFKADTLQTQGEKTVMRFENPGQVSQGVTGGTLEVREGMLAIEGELKNATVITKPTSGGEQSKSGFVLGTPDKPLTIGEDGVLVAAMDKFFKPTDVTMYGLNAQDGAKVYVQASTVLDGPIHVTGEGTLVKLGPKSQYYAQPVSISDRTTLTVTNKATLAFKPAETMELKGKVIVRDATLAFGDVRGEVPGIDKPYLRDPGSLTVHDIEVENANLYSTGFGLTTFANDVHLVNSKFEAYCATTFSKNLTADETSSLLVEHRRLVVQGETQLNGAKLHLERKPELGKLVLDKGAAVTGTIFSANDLIIKDGVVESENGYDGKTVEISGKTTIGEKGKAIFKVDTVSAQGPVDVAGQMSAPHLQVSSDVNVNKGGHVKVIEFEPLKPDDQTLTVDGGDFFAGRFYSRSLTANIAGVTVKNGGTMKAQVKGDIGKLEVTGGSKATLKDVYDTHEAKISGQGTDVKIESEWRTLKIGNATIDEGANFNMKMPDDTKYPIKIEGDISIGGGANVNLDAMNVKIGDKDFDKSSTVTVSEDGVLTLGSTVDGASVDAIHGKLSVGKGGKLSVNLSGNRAKVEGNFASDPEGRLAMHLGNDSEEGMADFKPLGGSTVSFIEGNLRFIPTESGHVAVAIEDVGKDTKISFPDMSTLSNMTPIVFKRRMDPSVRFGLPELANLKAIPNIFFVDRPAELFLENNSPDKYRLTVVRVPVTLPDGTVVEYFHLVVLPPVEGLLSGWLQSTYSALTPSWQVLPRLSQLAGVWVSVDPEYEKLHTEGPAKTRKVAGKVGWDADLPVGDKALRVGGYVGMTKTHTTLEEDARGSGVLLEATLYGAMPISEHFEVGMHASYKSMKSKVDSFNLSANPRFSAYAVSLEAASPWAVGSVVLTPQAQVTYTAIQGGKLDVSRGRSPETSTLEVSSLSSLVTRAGLDVSYTMKATQPWTLWGSAYVNYEWLGNQSVVKPSMLIHNRGLWTETGLGVSTVLGAWTFSLEGYSRLGQRRGFGAKLGANFAF